MNKSDLIEEVARISGLTHEESETIVTAVFERMVQALVREDGSFTFGFCKSCNWVGPARRARGKATRDAEAHLPECKGSGKGRIGVTKE